MWKKLKVLAVDEPTNRLDIEAQDVLFKALSTFRGVGILVSHDRRFLDSLVYKHWNIVEDRNMKGKYILNIQ